MSSLAAIGAGGGRCEPVSPFWTCFLTECTLNSLQELPGEVPGGEQHLSHLQDSDPPEPPAAVHWVSAHRARWNGTEQPQASAPPCGAATPQAPRHQAMQWPRLLERSPGHLGFHEF